MKEKLLILGRAGSGKTYLVIQKYLQFVKQHNEDKVMFILPTNSQVDHIRDHILRTSDYGGYLDTGLVTFYGLSRRILESVHQGKQINKEAPDLHVLKQIGEGEKDVLLSQLFKNVKTKYFSRVLDYAGFKRVFLDFVREIKENSLDTQSLKSILGSIQSGKTPSPFKQKYQELVEFYDCYQRILKKNGLVDEEDFLSRALYYLNENALSTVELLLIDGFHDYTQLELRFIKKLISIIPNVCITLPYQTSGTISPAFHASHKTYSQLAVLDFKEIKLDENNRTPSPILKHIEANIFTDVSNTKNDNALFGDANDSTSFQIIASANIQDEVEQITRNIKQLTLKHGYGFWQMGVIFRNVSKYQDIIEDTFARSKIPVRIYAKKPLKSNPLVQTILNTVKIHLDDWQDGPVWRVLKSGIGIDCDIINRLEVKYCHKGVVNDCDKWIKFTSSDEWKPINDFLLRLKKAFGCLNGRHTFSFYCKWYIEIVNVFYGPMFAASAQFNEDHDGLEMLKSDACALREFIAILNNTTLKNLVEGDGKLTFEDFCLILDSQIALTSYKKIDRRKNVVNVIDALEARQWEIPVVFVGGLLEKEFPGQIREDLFLKDFHRRRTNKTGKIVLREAAEQMDQEKYLFYIAITRAREKLFLSYPSTNSDGNATLPSFFLTDIMKLFKEEVLQKIITKRSLSRTIPGPEEMISTTDVRNFVYYHFNELYLPAKKQYEKDIALWLYNNFENGTTFREDISKLNDLIGSYGRLAGKTTDKKIIEIITHAASRFAPTKLKDYAQCPYKYFGGFTLDLRQITPVVLDFLMQGKIIHQILEDYFKENKARDIAEIFEERFKQETKGLVIGFEELKIKNEMLKSLLKFEAREKETVGPALRPLMFEEKFGGDKWGPIVIDDDKMGRIEISGKIDRIDVAEVDGEKIGVIVDYKYGKTEFKKEDVIEGIDLQLPIYMLALRDIFNIVPVAAKFYALKTLKETGLFNSELINDLKLNIKPPKNPIDNKEFDNLMEKTKDHILRFTGEIRNGRIDLAPYNLDRCGEGNCDFANVCRIEKWRVGGGF